MDKNWSSSPLSMTELGIYLDWTKNLQGTAYNIPWLYPLPQGTDLDRLREALTETVRAHPGILSRFAQGEDGNVMRKTPTGARETLPVTISESKGEPDLNKLIRPFSNPEDELYRFQIIQGKEQAWLFCDIHHILFDGHSEDVFLSELNRAYHGLTPVGETLSAADFARQEQKMRETDAFEAAKKWYVDMLDGEETVSEPFHDHEGESWKCDRLERELDLSFEEVSAFVKAAGIRTGSFFNRRLHTALAQPEKLFDIRTFAKSLQVLVESEGKVSSGNRTLVVPSVLVSAFYSASRVAQKNLHALCSTQFLLVIFLYAEFSDIVAALIVRVFLYVSLRNLAYVAKHMRAHTIGIFAD